MKVVCVFVICICMIINMGLVIKYVKGYLKWLLVTLLLVALVVSVNYGFFVLSIVEDT